MVRSVVWMSRLFTPAPVIAATTALVVELSAASAPFALSAVTLTWALKSNELGVAEDRPVPSTLNRGVEPPHPGSEVVAAAGVRVTTATVRAAAASTTATPIATRPDRFRRGGDVLTTVPSSLMLVPFARRASAHLDGDRPHQR